MNKTPVLNSSIFAAHKVALPDGRVTTIDTVLAEARLAFAMASPGTHHLSMYGWSGLLSVTWTLFHPRIGPSSR